MTVSNLTIVFLVLDILIGIAIPVGLFLYLRRRFGGSMIPFWFGCASFVLFALVLESIVHQIVLLRSPVGATIQGSIWLYALYGGLMAGLFEETGRLAAMKLLKKKHNRPATGLIYGAGHGGIEVIIVLVSTMVNYLVYAVMLNAGQMGAVLAAMDDANRQALTDVLQNLAVSSPFGLLLSPVERVSAVILHMALSVLVWRAVTKPGQGKLYFLAILLHAAMDAMAVILSRLGMNTVLLEILLLAFALGTAAFAKKLAKEEIAQ